MIASFARLRALLIQKSAKLFTLFYMSIGRLRALLIQKSAKHAMPLGCKGWQFESFVNSEECKTCVCAYMYLQCLRALLIQKSAKLTSCCNPRNISLRALLIQKSAKLPLQN